VTFDCTIEPSGPVRPGDILVFTSVVDPASTPADITFNHGDGTIDPRPIANAYYESVGSYDVTMEWRLGGLSGSIDCGTVEVIDRGTPGGFDANDYLGQTQATAVILAAANGFQARIVRIDDETFAVTLDAREDRINFEIDDGLVTKATIG